MLSKPPARSIKTRLTAVLLTCLLCPTLLVGWAAVRFEYDIVMQSRVREVGGVADARHAMLRLWLRHADGLGKGLLDTLIGICRYSDVGSHACAKPRMEQFAAIHHALALTLQAGADGDVTVGAMSVGELQPFVPGQLASVARSTTDGAAIIVLVAEDAASGIRLLSAYPVEALREVFTASAQLGASGETFLADKAGFFVTQPRHASVQGAVSPISAVPMQRCLNGESGETLGNDYRDTPIIHGFRFVPEIGGGCIMARVDQAEAFSSLKQLTNLLIVATLLFILSAVMAATYLGKRMASPILALTGMAKSLAQRDFTRRVSAGGYAEVAELSQLFNDLGAQLGETVGQLQTSRQNLETQVLERTEAPRLGEAHFRAVVQLVPNAFISADADGNIVFWNEAARRIFGYAEDEALGKPLTLLMPERFQTAHLQGLRRFLASGERRVIGKTVELAALRKDGAEFPIELSLAQGISRGQIFFTAILRDITEPKRAEQELRIAAAAFETQEGITITDAEHVIVRVNRAFTEITGYTAEEAIGKKPSILKSGRQDDAFYREMNETLHREGYWQGEIWDRHKDGHIYPKWLAIAAVKDDEGRVTHYVGNFADITERKAAEEKIQALAFYDTLTELPNRRLLMERLMHAIVTAQRTHTLGALFYLDLDNFKTLNDMQGHPVGDELLVEVAQRLKACVREVDTVARLGGDEFVVLLEDLDSDSEVAVVQAKSVAEKIAAAFRYPFTLSGGEHYCSTSIGIVLFSDHATPNSVLANADTAMYEAKRSGKNAYRFFDPAMQQTLESREEMESALRQALANQEFQLFYQLQIDDKNRPTGVEALIRWQHPVRGLIPPDEFIPIVEETGMMLNLGRWVLETACAQLRSWETAPKARDLTISVNISPKQFHHPAFVEEVREIMARYAIDPSKLKLELTENMVLEPVEEAVAKMQRLKSLGIALSMDDFGTGYSSLSYLKNLPFDQAKIDKSFVRGVQENASDAFIVSTVISIGKLLEMNVIAEGVEDKSQHEALKQLGCHAFQGYLFGRPVPVGEVEDRLSPPE